MGKKRKKPPPRSNFSTNSLTQGAISPVPIESLANHKDESNQSSRNLLSKNNLWKICGGLITLFFAPTLIYFGIRWNERPRLTIQAGLGMVEWAAQQSADSTYITSTLRDPMRNCTVWKGIAMLHNSIPYGLHYTNRAQAYFVLMNTGKVPLNNVKIGVHSQLAGEIRITSTPNIEVSHDSTFSFGVRNDILSVKHIAPKMKAVVEYSLSLPSVSSSITDSSEVRFRFLGSEELSSNQARLENIPLVVALGTYEKDAPLSGWVMPTDGYSILTDALRNGTTLFKILEQEGNSQLTLQSTCSNLNHLISPDTNLPPYLEIYPHTGDGPGPGIYSVQ